MDRGLSKRNVFFFSGAKKTEAIKQHQYLEFLEVLKRPEPRKRPRHGIRGSYCEIRNESRKPAAVAKATNRPPSR